MLEPQRAYKRAGLNFAQHAIAVPSAGSDLDRHASHRVSSRIVARAVAAEVTRRKCFSCQNPPPYVDDYNF